jgi:hypothetical protein
MTSGTDGVQAGEAGFGTAEVLYVDRGEFAGAGHVRSGGRVVSSGGAGAATSTATGIVIVYDGSAGSVPGSPS